jgi:hypothetical protein
MPYFTNTRSYQHNSKTVTSLEWALNSPIPLHAYKMLPIQS